jgi:hypothetical protein
VCKSADFYRAYLHWTKINRIEPSFLGRFFVKAKDHLDVAKKGMGSMGEKHVRVMIPAGARVGIESGEWYKHTGREVARFSEALKRWETET